MRAIPSDILSLNHELQNHPMYKKINNTESLQVFMGYHIFAVWDFMSLLKSLQQKITCVTVPWTPSAYPSNIVRMINEIVVGEESDLDQNGKAKSHFELYINAMNEVGANTQPILNFLKKLDTTSIPSGAKEFVNFNIEIAKNAPLHKVAGAFLFGREKVIPEMFQGILNYINTNKLNCPTLIYYLERHIQLDGEEHSVLALQCLEVLCGDDDKLWQEAVDTGIQSLLARKKLWDEVELAIIRKNIKV